MAVDDNVIEGLAIDNDDDENRVMLFGKDVSKIPCFKDSFLTGIYAGFGCGIASFLATSKVIQSTHISVISFVLVTYGYWFQCRWKWAKNDYFSRQSQGTFYEEIEAIKSRKKTN